MPSANPPPVSRIDRSRIIPLEPYIAEKTKGMARERHHPLHYVPDTEEDLIASRLRGARLVADQDEELKFRIDEIFPEWKQGRIDAGLPIRVDPDLMPFEEPRLEGFLDLVVKFLERVPVYQSNRLSRADFMARNPQVPDTPEGKNPMIPALDTLSGDFIILDKDNQFFLSLFRRGGDINMGASTRRLEDIAADADAKREEVYQPDQKPDADSRHNSAFHEERHAHYEKIGKPVRLDHIGYMPDNGHRYDANYERSSHFCQAPSKDYMGGGPGPDQERKAKSTQTFLEDVTPEAAAIGILLSLLDPKTFDAQKSHFESFVKAGKLIKYSEYQLFPLVVRVLNTPVLIHKDPDAKDVIGASIPFGQYVGAEFVFPEADLRFTQLPGSIVIAPFCLAAHGVRDYKGDSRGSHIFTAKTTDQSQKSRSQMTPEEELAQDAKDEARRLKVLGVDERRKAREQALIDSYLASTGKDYDDFPYPDNHRLREVKEYPDFLIKANKKKEEVLSALRGRLETDESVKAELEATKKLPASSFYEFAEMESRRVKRREPPFKRRSHTSLRNQGPRPLSSMTEPPVQSSTRKRKRDDDVSEGRSEPQFSETPSTSLAVPSSPSHAEFANSRRSVRPSLRADIDSSNFDEPTVQSPNEDLGSLQTQTQDQNTGLHPSAVDPWVDLEDDIYDA